MRALSLRAALAGVAAFAFFASQANAASTISVVNSSFETPVLSNGAQSDGCPSGWSCSGGAQGPAGFSGTTSNPTAPVFAFPGEYANQVPDGSNYLYIGQNPGNAFTPQTVTQIISSGVATVSSGATYSLSAFVGALNFGGWDYTANNGGGAVIPVGGSCPAGHNCAFNDAWRNAGGALKPTIELLAGTGNNIATYSIVAQVVTTDPTTNSVNLLAANKAVLLGDSNVGEVGDGNGVGGWEQFTATWLATSQYAGDQLAIVLIIPIGIGNSGAVVGSSSATGWDDVALSYTASATPLPATLPLFVSGLGALGLLARRQKRKAALAA